MDDQWIFVEGKREGRAYMAGLRHPFDRSRWPDFQHHVAVSLGYAPQWRNGLPKPKELTRLQGIEDQMIDSMEGHGELVASETSDARRTLHLFVRGGGPLLEMFRDWESRGEQGGVSVSVAHDPEWRNVAHLTQVSQRAA